MTALRDQIVLDLTESVLSEATRTAVRLENEGINSGEAIRLVRTALANVKVTDAELAQRLVDERRRSERDDAPDDRELGGQG